MWYPALFAAYDRPFLIVSTDEHPFQGDEYVGLAVTTDLPDAIELREDEWAVGGLPKRSFVKPWNPTVLKGSNVESVAGALASTIVDSAVDALSRICGRPR